METNYTEDCLIKLEDQSKEAYQGFENRQRLDNILDMIGKIAALDFSVTLDLSDKNDVIDAISLGLNMLSEELNSKVVEKAKVDEVNRKLERFAFTTAHDLKSPLNSSIGLLLLIEMSISPGEKSKLKLYVSKLKEVIEQMKSLITGILDYSRTTTEIKKEEVDLNEVFKEVISLDCLESRAQIKIIGELPHVLFNRTSMIQIVRNLFNNAIAHCDKEICKVIVEAKEQSDHYQIIISDNGPGIASENHERIFELFTKINSKAKLGYNHGIGLATVKNILESEGEKIWVDSSLGNGAKFIFTLRKCTVLKIPSGLMI